MEIYIEFLILDNFVSNACISYATLRAVGRYKASRVVVASLVATAIGVVYPLLTLPEIWDAAFKLLTSVVVVIFLDFRSKFADFFKELVLFYAISFVFGGFLSAVLNIFNINKTHEGLTFLLCIGAVVVLLILRTVARIFRAGCPTHVGVNLGGVSLVGLWDSGNGLRTIDGMPVHVVSRDVKGISCQNTGRKIDVKTVSGSYLADLYIADGFCATGLNLVSVKQAYFVYSKQDLGPVKVVLNEGAKTIGKGVENEKLFCKADKKTACKH